MLCAVPKERKSIHKRRKMRAANELLNAKWDYLPYRTCGGCGEHVRQHFLCLTCMKLPPARPKGGIVWRG
jgi:ribosomal protein L32